MTEQTAEQALAEADIRGAPYEVPRGGVSYEQALAIARSAHPSRVLANTMGYRYGRFTEKYPGTTAPPWVEVHMMGSHIATFKPGGVTLWARDWATASTTEALGNLVTGGWFWSQKGQVFFERYGQRTPPDYTPAIEPLTEGAVFHYTGCPHCGCGGE